MTQLGSLVPEVKPSEVGKRKPADYIVRFVFGAGIALLAGLIGMRFGPVVGGVFLAFPAILPASLTLIERQEGREAAEVDSMGAVLGAVAMVAFAVLVSVWVTRWGVIATLVVALAVWSAAAGALYVLVAAASRRERSP